MSFIIKPLSEEAFQRQVIQLARLRGWRCVHFRAARTTKGWRTPVQADGKGWLDLVLVRERVLFIELKSDVGRLTREQEEWVVALCAAGQEVHIWRPKDWLDIEVILAPVRQPASKEVTALLLAGYDAKPCGECGSLKTVRSGPQFVCERCGTRGTWR